MPTLALALRCGAPHVGVGLLSAVADCSLLLDLVRLLGARWVKVLLAVAVVQ
jgi:hypothetical protein